MLRKFVFIFIMLTTGCTLLPAQERGMASYYSNRMHGHRMSDGTRYHKDSLTCAHRRYPLGTKLKVTNIKNGKSVVVKVTDRCGRRRIIDLSYAAAKTLGIITQGVAMVTVEKYTEKRIAPFKQEETIDIPELDFEITKGDRGYIPAWQTPPKKGKK